MKTILVPLETDDLAESTLETAVLLAKVFGSYIEGFAFRPLPSSILATDPTGAALVFGTNIQRENDRVEASRRTFEKFMLTHDVSRRTNATARPSFGWREEASPGDYFVGSYSRVFDIAVIGRLGANEAKPRMSTLEAALFETGRPVLIAPRVAPLRLGRAS